MRLLPRRVSSGQYWPGFAEPELQLPEQALALSDAQFDSVAFLDPSRQGLAIPQIDPHPRVARLLPQHSINLLDLFLIQPAGPPGPFSLRQARQALLLEAVNPILHRTWGVP